MRYERNVIKARVAVLSLIPSAAPFSLSVVKGFLEANCDVCWFTGGFRDSDFTDLVPEEVSLFCFGDFSKSRPRRFFDLLMGLIRHGAKLREVDKVIMTWHGPFLIDLLIFLFLRQKLIFFEHNVIPHCDQKPRKRDFVRWVLAKKVFVPSSSALLVFKKFCRIGFLRKKVSVFQHPLIDVSGAEMMDYPRPSPRIGQLAFVGAARGNRGLIQLLSLVSSEIDCCLTVFSAGASLVLSGRRDQKKLMDRLFVIDDYFGQTEFINILKKPYIFVLPYVNSSQSGVFYSLISNDALFICTDTGETGRVLYELGLQELLFDLDDPESFIRALNFVMSNNRGVREVLYAYREQLANQLRADVACVLFET